MSVYAAIAPVALRRRVSALRAQQRRSGAESKVLVRLTLLALVLTVLIVRFTGVVPLNSLLVPLLVGSLVLGPGCCRGSWCW